MAETGRSSTTKLGAPLRPQVYSELLHEFVDQGLSVHTTTKHGPRADIRKMYVVDPGYVILEVDQSQAEARVVSHLSDDHETLRLFDTTDIHKLTAGFIFGKDPKCVDLLPDGSTREGSPERFIGKTARHAGAYGQGKRTLMMDANAKAKKYGVPLRISEKEAGKILEQFHKFTPKIRGVYHPSIERALRDNKRVLVNPFGRPRFFLGRFDEATFREGYSTIPQGTVIDQTRFGFIQVKKKGPPCKPLLEWHDAGYWLVEEKYLKELYQVAKEAFETPIDFSRCTLSKGLLTIPCEAKVYRENFYKSEKYNG